MDNSEAAWLHTLQLHELIDELQSVIERPDHRPEGATGILRQLTADTTAQNRSLVNDLDLGTTHYPSNHKEDSSQRTIEINSAHLSPFWCDLTRVGDVLGSNEELPMRTQQGNVHQNICRLGNKTSATVSSDMLSSYPVAQPSIKANLLPNLLDGSDCASFSFPGVEGAKQELTLNGLCSTTPNQKMTASCIRNEKGNPRQPFSFARSQYTENLKLNISPPATAPSPFLQNVQSELTLTEVSNDILYITSPASRYSDNFSKAQPSSDINTMESALSSHDCSYHLSSSPEYCVTASSSTQQTGDNGSEPKKTERSTTSGDRSSPKSGSFTLTPKKTSVTNHTSSSPLPESTVDGKKKMCANCKCTSTTMWRRGTRNQYLCNACGTYYRTHGVPRPVISEEQDRASPVRCSNCKISATSVWRTHSDGSKICNACALYYRVHKKPRPENLHRNTQVFKRRRRTQSSQHLFNPHRMLHRLYSGSTPLPCPGYDTALAAGSWWHSPPAFLPYTQ